MNKLIILALLTDLLMPILLWKTGIPTELRWISHLALAVVSVAALAGLLRARNVPKAFWLFVVFSVIGVVMGLLSGQGMPATLWGWYLMFKYPLVGLYVYLNPHWSERFPERLRAWCIRILWLEVAIQARQYLNGEMPGDSLAGTLGVHGTGVLAMLVLWVVALALGNWIVRGRLTQVVLVIALGTVSSVLGEMKIYFFAVGILGLLALVIQGVRRQNLAQLIPYAVAVLTFLWIFPRAYDAVVPSARIHPFSEYWNWRSLSRYASIVQYVPGSASYDVGRGYALSYVWNQISASPVTQLFGEGLGARGVSQTFGVAGIGVLSGEFGLFTGTSLVVIVGELGLSGLLALSAFMVSVLRTLWRAASVEGDTDLAGIQYGLFLYTLLWPLWLYYTAAWVLAVPMLLYWLALGYVLGQWHKADRSVLERGVSYVHPSRLPNGSL